MQRLEVSGAVRPLYGSLGFKGLILEPTTYYCLSIEVGTVSEIAYESVNIRQFKCAVHDRCGRSVAIGRETPAP